MSDLGNVKVGDKLYYDNRWNEFIVIVTRVTATQVVCGKQHFAKTNGKLIGQGRWDCIYALPATESIIKRLKAVGQCRRLQRHLELQLGNPRNLLFTDDIYTQIAELADRLTALEKQKQEAK